MCDSYLVDPKSQFTSSWATVVAFAFSIISIGQYPYESIDLNTVNLYFSHKVYDVEFLLFTVIFLLNTGFTLMSWGAKLPFSFRGRFLLLT